MGIKSLNKFIKTRCFDCLSKITLSDLTNRQIAIDASIYMYKFISDDTLIENMYLMVSLFKKNNITPIFVFDGKPPAEKQEIINERQIKKAEAKVQYDKQKQRLLETTDESKRYELEMDMLKLKKKFISIKNSQIREVKELLDAMGVSYYTAEGEADNMCAWLTIKQKVYACLSDDMDMFAFGCPRIIRYYNIYKGTMLMYDTKKILKKLKLTQNEFRELCILSGSDYNSCSDEKCSNHCRRKYGQNMFNYYDIFQEHKKLKKNNNQCVDFYEYLEKTQNLPNTESSINFSRLINVIEMFDINKLEDIKLFIDKNKDAIQENIQQNYKKDFDDNRIREILKKDGFVF